MYTEIKDYISYELYPALYDRLDEEGVLEEFKFKKQGSHYVSTTANKHSGRTGKTKGQVIVYENNPAYLIDHSETPSSQDIIEYVQHIQSGEEMPRVRNPPRRRPCAPRDPLMRSQHRLQQQILAQMGSTELITD